MPSIQDAVLDLKKLELLAHGSSAIHRLDARAKVLVTLLFISCVVSFDRYALSTLLPFFIFPVVMISLTGLPMPFIAKKVLQLCPFVLAIGIFNPLFDRAILLQLGSMEISGGWISCASIMIRSLLTVSAGFILVAVTGFTAVCQALEKLGLPQVFTVQLLFLYRYIFVLAEEWQRASRARELRSCGTKGPGIAVFAALAGHLLLRTWERADRIHSAMRSRGFTGQFHTRNLLHFGSAELTFLLGWTAVLISLRTINIPHILGICAAGLLP